jgi:hypothetical protein
MVRLRNNFSAVQSGLMKRLLRQARTLIWGGGRLTLLFSVLLVTSVASALAQEEVTFLFASPSKPLTAGGRGSVWLYCMNNSSSEVSRTFEPSLNCTLISPSASFETVLHLRTSSSPITATIAPGGFVKEEYQLDIPLTSNGRDTLDVRDYNQVMVLVEQASTGILSAPQPP